MRTLFHEILYRPLLNALVWLYNTVSFTDLGIAIILLTILIRFLLFPLFYKSFKNQTLLQRLQPEVKKIQHQHKKNKEKQAKALMELYKTHNVNPLSGIMLLFVQLPILIALYRVFLNDFSSAEVWSDLYVFIAAPTGITNTFLGLINLGERSMIIVALAVGATYLQSRLALPKKQGGEEEKTAAGKVGRQMVYIGPILTLVILPSLPAAIGLYWLTSSLFSAIQQRIINKEMQKNHVGGISKPSETTDSPDRTERPIG